MARETFEAMVTMGMSMDRAVALLRIECGDVGDTPVVEADEDAVLVAEDAREHTGLSGRIVAPHSRGNRTTVERARAANAPSLVSRDSSAGVGIGIGGFDHRSQDNGAPHPSPPSPPPPNVQPGTPGTRSPQRAWLGRAERLAQNSSSGSRDSSQGSSGNLERGATPPGATPGQGLRRPEGDTHSRSAVSFGISVSPAAPAPAPAPDPADTSRRMMRI